MEGPSPAQEVAERFRIQRHAQHCDKGLTTSRHAATSARVARLRACNTPGRCATQMAPQQCARECQQRCFSLPSGLQALNHVLDGAESGGLHHERMCGAAELMSNTRMHRASKQNHHLDNLVRRSLGCTECHADRRSRFNVYMKAVFSGHYHIDKQYFQKWERTAHGRTTGLLRLRKHPG